MASNLPKQNFKLIVHDADNSKVQRAVSEWKNTSASNGDAEAFKDCDVIVTMLPQGEIVRDVVLGEGGIARGLKDGMYTHPQGEEAW